MTGLAILAKGGLYLSLAVIVGYWLLRLFPQGRKPEVRLPAPLLAAAYFLLPLALFIPPVQLSYGIAPQVEDSFWSILWSVLKSFEMGEAFWAALLITLALAVLHWSRPRFTPTAYNWTGFLLALFLVLAQSWGSHAAGVTEYLGFLAQSSHVLAISLWIGPLLLVAWFGQSFKQWPAFLAWFTPLAMLCVATIITTGMVMMTFITPQPIQSLILSYGQTLLIKHLLLLPVLILGLINSWVSRRLLAQSEKQLTRWLKAESGLALLLLAVTASLSQQAPPHDQLAQAVKYAGISPLFRLFFPELAESGRLAVAFNLLALLLFLTALFIALLIIRNRGRSLLFTLAACAVLVILLYLAVMLSLEEVSPVGAGPGEPSFSLLPVVLWIKKAKTRAARAIKVESKKASLTP